MKKVIATFLVSLLIMCSLPVAAARATSDSQGETTVPKEETRVTFRVIPAAGWQLYAGATLQLMSYADAEREQPLEEFSINVARNRSWQATVSLPTGLYYKVVCAMITNELFSSYAGVTPVFQTVGNKMTVYCGIPNSSGIKPEMPESWCVEGEDTQNFEIWGSSESSTVSTNSGYQSSENTEGETITPIPGHETDVVPDSERIESTVRVPIGSDESEANEEKASSVLIGDIITIGIVVVIIAACSITMVVINRRKKQIK